MKKNTFKSPNYYLLAALPILFLLTCANVHDIAGKWQEPETKFSLEFLQDGTFIVVDNMGMTSRGTYRFIDKEKIRFEIKHSGTFVEILIGEFTVKDDELILTFDLDKEVMTYKKVR